MHPQLVMKINNILKPMAHPDLFEKNGQRSPFSKKLEIRASNFLEQSWQNCPRSQLKIQKHRSMDPFLTFASGIQFWGKIDRIPPFTQQKIQKHRSKHPIFCKNKWAAFPPPPKKKTDKLIRASNSSRKTNISTVLHNKLGKFDQGIQCYREGGWRFPPYHPLNITVEWPPHDFEQIWTTFPLQLTPNW